MTSQQAQIMSARMDAQREIIERLTEANEVMWSKGVVYEDDLPDVTDETFRMLHKVSKVDIVRVYPKIIVEGMKAILTNT